MTVQDSAIEQEIRNKGLAAPRVTPNDLEANIKSEWYFTAADGASGAHGVEVYGSTPLGTMVPIESLDVPDELELLTFCVLILQNGFTVTGESACASEANFDAELGRKIARQNAVQKLWPLMGYELKSKLSSNLFH
jgi:Phage protein (N4 Gp49/phage Sf6 gene 66) family